LPLLAEVLYFDALFPADLRKESLAVILWQNGQLTPEIIHNILSTSSLFRLNILPIKFVAQKRHHKVRHRLSEIFVGDGIGW